MKRSGIASLRSLKSNNNTNNTMSEQLISQDRIASSGEKNRIDFFDLAKGFCIFLVVIYHVSVRYEVELPASNIMKSIRLPLYFFLSGCFFKTYGGLLDFVIRKLNKLLLPFVFWFLFSFLFAFFLFVFFDIQYFTTFYQLNIHSVVVNTLHGDYPNVYVWFLLCLFWVNLIFYTSHLLSGKFDKKLQPLAIGLLSIIIGVVGVTFSNYGIEVPFYIDSAFTSVPFFAFGYYSFRFTALAKKNKMDKWIPLFVILFVLFLYFVAPKYDLRSNSGISYQNVWLIYLCGFLGVLSVVLLSKMIRKLPLVSFWGRYSIMILVSHGIVFKFVSVLISSSISKIIEMNSVELFVLNLFFTMSICTLLIPFMKKYMPHVTAQKDIIPVGNR